MESAHVSEIAVYRGSAPRVALGVVQVEAIGPNGDVVPINVMLDEGSDATLIRAGLTKRLGIKGTPRTLDIGGVGGIQTRVPQSSLVKLQIKTGDGECLAISGSTMPTVTKPVSLVDWNQLKTQWDHLADLPLRPSGGQVDVLLGLDHGELMMVTDSRGGREGEPFASRTRLGWIVRGVIGKDVKTAQLRVSATCLTAHDNEPGQGFNEALQRFFDTESFGTEHQVACMSPDNQRAVAVLDRGLKKLEVGYEAPVLWKPGQPNLPDNRIAAENRLKSLTSRFQKDADFEKEYRKAMQTNFEEGYAVRLNQDEVRTGPSYYLAHFGVSKPNSSKVRIVFDAAAKFKGQCLNDCISSGPALQNSLASVLIRFREGEVAWSSDIKAMYSRVRLNDQDRRYHRFLWPEENGTISTCEMTRVTFGVTCSPFVAIKSTWRAAEDAGPEFQDAYDAIKNNLYVDDYLGSAPDTERGVAIASRVQCVLAAGDFHLRGWRSNSPEFLRLIDSSPERGDNNTKQSLGPEESEKVLGVVWTPANDTLGS